LHQVALVLELCQLVITIATINCSDGHGKSNIEVAAKAAVEAVPAPPSAMEQAVATTAAMDNGRTRQGSTAVMATTRRKVRWWQYAAVEAMPAHCCATEQAVTTTATSNDENDKKATFNCFHGHNKKQ